MEPRGRTGRRWKEARRRREKRVKGRYGGFKGNTLGREEKEIMAEEEEIGGRSCGGKEGHELWG